MEDYNFGRSSSDKSYIAGNTIIGKDGEIIGTVLPFPDSSANQSNAVNSDSRLSPIPPSARGPRALAYESVLDLKTRIGVRVGGVVTLLVEILFVIIVMRLNKPFTSSGNTVTQAILVIFFCVIGILIGAGIGALIGRYGLTLLIIGVVGGGIVAANIHANVLYGALGSGLAGFIVEWIMTIVMMRRAGAAAVRRT